jgi:hypothetical protein
MNRHQSRAVHAWAASLCALVPSLAPEERARLVDLHDAATAVLDRRAPPGRLEPAGAPPARSGLRHGFRLVPAPDRRRCEHWGRLGTSSVRCLPRTAADRESARLERVAGRMLRG